MVQILARLTKFFCFLLLFPVKCHSSLTSKAIAKHICLAESRQPNTQPTKSRPDGKKAMKLPEIDTLAGQLSQQPGKRNSARLLISEMAISSKVSVGSKGGSLPEKTRLSRRQIHKQHEGDRALSFCFPSMACVQV